MKVNQAITSANTSINSNRLPAIYNMLKIGDNNVVFDYGCGKYIDHIKQHLGNSVSYLPYDPFNQPEYENVESLSFLYMADYVVCSNVLNVIGDDNLDNTVDELISAAKVAECPVYITVYEGDLSGVGKITKKDCYQRNQPLSFYADLFADRGCRVVRKGKLLIVTIKN